MSSTPGPLRVRTVRAGGSLADTALTSLLPPGVPAADVLAWVRRGEGMVAWGRAAAVRTAGATRFADARAWWADVVRRADVREEVDTAGSGLVAFGSFAYAAASDAGGTLVVPRYVVGRRDGVTWLTTVDDAGARPPEPPSPDLAPAPDLDPAPDPAPTQEPTPEPPAPGRIRYSDGEIGAAAYRDAVSRAVEAITAGRLDKVVLARDLAVEAERAVDPRYLVARLAETYERTWVFSVDRLVGATPEMLVRLDRGLVTSRVLAGTIRRTGDDDRDLALAGSLARSSKDLEEHEYAVRSVADALAPHCTSMNVPESPSVLHLPNVMHLASDVAGRLRNGADSLTLAEALHPSAAVCGTPRESADALIARLEGMDRERYAGPVGWIDAAGDGEWGIGLRCGALDPDDPRRMRLFAGCGIVAGSDPASELAESEAKLLPMRAALGG